MCVTSWTMVQIWTWNFSWKWIQHARQFKCRRAHASASSFPRMNLKILNQPSLSSRKWPCGKQTTIHHITSKQPFPASQATSTMKRRVDQRKERCKIIAWLQIAWMQKANDRVRKMTKDKSVKSWSKSNRELIGGRRENTKEESSRSNWNHLEHPSWL